MSQTKTPILRILVIDDDPGDTELARRMLADISEWDTTVIDCEDADCGFERIERGDADLAVIDFYLGGVTGLNLLEQIRQRDQLFPVIILTGSGNEETAAQALRAGASDYLVKGTLSANAFRHAIFNALEKKKLAQQVQQKQQELQEKVKELQEALAQVRQLEGIIPICMHCKRIRDDSESWHQIEEYVSQHSDAEFSHTLCRECLEQYYPEIAAQRKARKQLS